MPPKRNFIALVLIASVGIIFLLFIYSEQAKHFHKNVLWERHEQLPEASSAVPVNVTNILQQLGEESLSQGNITSEFAKVVLERDEALKRLELVQKNTVVDDPIIFMTIVSAGQMPHLRNLVGSIHMHRKDNTFVPLIVVYGFALEKIEKREIRTWRNVELQEVDKELFLPIGTAKLEDQHDNYELFLNIIEITIRKYGHAFHIPIHLRFEKLENIPKLTEIINKFGSVFVEEGNHELPDLQNAFFGFRYNTVNLWTFVSEDLQCLRGYQCDESLKSLLDFRKKEFYNNTKVNMNSAGLKRVKDDEKNVTEFCWILLRDDILYSFELAAAKEKPEKLPPSSKITIAFGVPSKTHETVETASDTSFNRLLLPSFIKTLKDDEIQNFRFAFYIGYDEGDFFLDDPEKQKQTEEYMWKILKENLSSKVDKIEDFVYIRFVRFPFSKGWVTLLWNGLFVRSIYEGCDYFFQINDDIELITPGWATQFVNSLKQNNNIGVTGPLDPVQGGRIFTQSFVHRNHYEIFGRLYPIDIKDWFSDDWISSVYGPEHSFKNEFMAKNTNDKGTRYSICHQPNYGEKLNRGKQIVERWREFSKNVTGLEKVFLNGPLMR